MLAASPLAGVLLKPFPRDPSQEEAQRELSKQLYRQQESLLDTIVNWIFRKITELLAGITGGSAEGSAAVAVIALVVIAVIVAVLVKFGPLSRTRRRRTDEASHLAPTTSDDEHRRKADAHAAEGRFAEAIRERLRAIIRGLTDRGVLDNRLGRTAMEVATEAGRKLPTIAGDLRDAASLFGAVWYGRRPATAGDYERMRTIDGRVAAARPGGQAAETVAAGSWALPSGAGGGQP
jgi:hypothetical protein